MATVDTDELMSEEGRALLTDRESDILSGRADVSDNYEYKVKSVVRNRLRKRLGDDDEFLAMVFGEIRDRSDGGFETVEFVSVAEGLAAAEGINLARVVNENPAIVDEFLGDDVSLPERTVEEFDRIVDEHYEPDAAA